MHVIKTAADVRRLVDSGALPADYARTVEEEFRLLHQALGDGEDEATFSLQSHGYIVILEAADDVRDLSEVGLHPDDGGLLGSMPEYVDRIVCGDGTKVYKIGVLCADDYMLLFFTQVGVHDRRVERWLYREAQKSAAPASP